MALYYCDDDILETTAHGMVNPVNCELVCTGGLALQVLLQYPEHYKSLYSLQRLEPGCIHWTEQLLDGYRFTIVDIATKHRTKERSTLELIEAGLNTLIENFDRLDMQSIAIPALGCGMGKMEWRHMHEPLLRILEPLYAHHDVHLYVPQPTIQIWGGKVQGVIE